MMAILVTFDVNMDDGKWNMGNGFPKIRDFLEEVIPNLSLNLHNPDINGLPEVSNGSNGAAGGKFRGYIGLDTNLKTFSCVLLDGFMK
jgi:hypothetical protein